MGTKTKCIGSDENELVVVGRSAITQCYPVERSVQSMAEEELIFKYDTRNSALIEPHPRSIFILGADLTYGADAKIWKEQLGYMLCLEKW